jgi:L,D-transpeptidase YcbB
MHVSVRAIFWAGLALASVAPCILPSHAAETNALSVRPNATKAIRIAIQERLSAISGARKQEQAALVDYYSAPDSRLLWVDGNGLTNSARAVMEEIRRADEYGLRPSDYPLPKVSDESTNTKWLADAEIKISLAVMGYARDARGGRIDPARLSPNLEPVLALPKPLEVIESIAIRSDPAAYLRSFEPDQPEFEALRKALAVARGGTDRNFVKIPDGPLLQLGVEHEQVPLLRQRLQVPADKTASETLFDASVDAAVKRFKAAHGAVPDGIVGPDTRRLLNQPRQQAANPERLRLILLNMERWRWLPQDLGSTYVMVNVPEFVLRVVDGGKQVHAARVVVGKPGDETPILSSEIQEVAFNPYWTVPDKIKTEKILPHILDEAGVDGSGASVLQRNNLHISVGGREIDPLSVDWARVDIRSLNLYQPPGPDNMLGSVKFTFSSNQDVYLHDTPQKTMFAEPVRAESFGTVRVQSADRLALILLKQDQGWTDRRVAASIQNGHDQHVALKQTIPVYLTYFTLSVNGDGSISTFRDIYGHDARMAAALFSNDVAFDPRADKRQGTQVRRSGAMGDAIAESLSGFIDSPSNRD